MKIIYGGKGSGKTKYIVDMTIKSKESAKGDIIFIAPSDSCSFDIKYPVRYIDLSKFDIKGEDGFRGFLKGIIAGNGDIEYVFVDSILKITGKQVSEIENTFTDFEKLEKEFGVKFVVSVSCEKEDLPKYLLNTKFITPKC